MMASQDILCCNYLTADSLVRALLRALIDIHTRQVHILSDVGSARVYFSCNRQRPLFVSQNKHIIISSSHSSVISIASKPVCQEARAITCLGQSLISRIDCWAGSGERGSPATLSWQEKPLDRTIQAYYWPRQIGLPILGIIFTKYSDGYSRPPCDSDCEHRT